MKTFQLICLLIFCATIRILAQEKPNVHIKGKVTATKLSKLRVRHFDFVLQKSTIVAEAALDSTNRFELAFFLPKPQYLQLGNAYVWISPNDTIAVVMGDENYVTDAKGKNKYNYLMKSKLKSMNYTVIDRNLSDWSLYYKDLSSEYDEKMAMIAKYADSMAVDYKKYVEIDTKYNIVHRKLVPIKAGFVSRSVADDFIKDVDLSLFNRNEVDNYGYAVALKEFYDFKLGNNKEDYNRENLAFKYELINALFREEDREALILLMLKPFASQTIEPYAELIKQLFVKEKAAFQDSIRLNQLKHIESITTTTNQYFSKEVLSTKFKDASNNDITLSAIIEANKNKVIVVDFWATWCGACIEAFPALSTVQQQTENSEVVYMFVSFDRKYEDWVRGKSRWPKSNLHYFLPEGFNSLLCRNLYFTGIPRTIIINKKGNLAIYNAPSPMNGSRLFNLIKEIETQP
ncbi:MAG TPA: hypothetical protein DCR35_07605 [Runella sp.]|nr:hypothetical protein [Runella sp.]